MNWLAKLLGRSSHAVRPVRPPEAQSIPAQPQAQADSIERTIAEGMEEALRVARAQQAKVDDQPTYELAEAHQDDLAMMLRCCEAELEAMRQHGRGPAPFYFERAAILYRKQGEYGREVEVCERYIQALEAFYKTPAGAHGWDIRTGARYPKIVARLPKARELARRAGQI